MKEGDQLIPILLHCVHVRLLPNTGYQENQVRGIAEDQGAAHPRLVLPHVLTLHQISEEIKPVGDSNHVSNQ